MPMKKFEFLVVGVGELFRVRETMKANRPAIVGFEIRWHVGEQWRFGGPSLVPAGREVSRTSADFAVFEISAQTLGCPPPSSKSPAQIETAAEVPPNLASSQERLFVQAGACRNPRIRTSATWPRTVGTVVARLRVHAPIQTPRRTGLRDEGSPRKSCRQLAPTLQSLRTR